MLKKHACLLVVVVVGCMARTERPLNELPMYGGNWKGSAVEQDKKYSETAVRCGWDYFYAEKNNEAIKQFNIAWTYNTNNASAYWGFGLVMGKRAEVAKTYKTSAYCIREAIKHLSKALELDAENPKIMVDLAVAYTGLGSFKKESGKDGEGEAFLRANEMLEKAQRIAPDYPLLWINWAYLKYYQGDFALAEEYLIKAKEMGVSVSENFEKDLKGAADEKGEGSVP